MRRVLRNMVAEVEKRMKEWWKQQLKELKVQMDAEGEQQESERQCECCEKRRRV